MNQLDTFAVWKQTKKNSPPSALIYRTVPSNSEE